MSKTELAWAAGFFDGEGHVATNHARKSPVLRIRVEQVDRRPLDRFQAAVGVGKVLGPYLPPSKVGTNRQPYFSFAVAGKKALRVIDALEPFLSEPKREQARSAVTRLSELRAQCRT